MLTYLHMYMPWYEFLIVGQYDLGFYTYTKLGTKLYTKKKKI